MIIGNFRCDWKDDEFRGEIRTLALHHENVKFRSFNKSREDDPDYLMVVEGQLGEFELGAAWEHQDKDGKQYLSLQLSDPILGIEIEAQLNFIGNDWAVLVCPPEKRKPKGR
jgi:uncharacterized protein (DUF736 family)